MQKIHSANELILLGKALLDRGYEFVTVTPKTHEKVLSRMALCEPARELRDIFGWNRSFDPMVLDGDIRVLLERSRAFTREGGTWRAAVRFSNLGSGIFMHSAFPTEHEDSVFFGPDTYRFVRFLDQVDVKGGRVADIGAGCGGGGLSVFNRVDELVLADINRTSLDFARVNHHINFGAALRPVEFVHSDGLNAVQGKALDWVLANPPFLIDASQRSYRHGGGEMGAEISLRWAREASGLLSPGGRLVMYTASAIQGGCDHLNASMRNIAREAGLKFEYSEIDPDIFGEELDRPEYAHVDRLAAVGLVMHRA